MARFTYLDEGGGGGGGSDGGSGSGGGIDGICLSGGGGWGRVGTVEGLVIVMKDWRCWNSCIMNVDNK